MDAQPSDKRIHLDVGLYERIFRLRPEQSVRLTVVQIMNNWVTAEEDRLRTVAPVTTTPPPATQAPTTEAGWPLDDVARAFCVDWGLEEWQLRPDPNGFKHVEMKKRMLREGYRCSGMYNQDDSVSLLVADIQNPVDYEHLSDQARAKYGVLVGHFQKWRKRRGLG